MVVLGPSPYRNNVNDVLENLGFSVFDQYVTAHMSEEDKLETLLQLIPATVIKQIDVYLDLPESYVQKRMDEITVVIPQESLLTTPEDGEAYWVDLRAIKNNRKSSSKLTTRRNQFVQISENYVRKMFDTPVLVRFKDQAMCVTLGMDSRQIADHLPHLAGFTFHMTLRRDEIVELITYDSMRKVLVTIRTFAESIKPVIGKGGGKSKTAASGITD